MVAEKTIRKISIIIPFYNSRNTLRECFDAVQRLETDVELEVVVVDDKSIDDGAEIARNYPFRLVSCERNGGAGYARNQGCRVADGDLFFFVDADVVLPPNAISLALGPIKNNQADCVVGVFSAENPYVGFFTQYKSLYCNWKYQGIEGGSAVNLGTTAILASVYKNLGGFNESLAASEDSEFGNRLFKMGYRVFVEHKLEVLHLRSYTFLGLIRNDFNKSRVLAQLMFRDMRSRSLARQQGFSDISRGMMANIPLVYLIFFFLLAAVYTVSMVMKLLAVTLVAAFVVNNRSFFRFIWKRKPYTFFLGAVFFTYLDYLIVGVAVISALNTLVYPGVSRRSEIRAR